MKQSVVDAVLQLQQPFEVEADDGHQQIGDGQNKVEHNRKTRQRDHQCHCGKNFQVGKRNSCRHLLHQPGFFQFSWGLKNHMESEHEGKDVCCTHCNKMFVNPVNLRRHLSQRICLGGSARILTAPVKQVEPGSVGSDLGEDIQVVRLLG